MQVDLIAQIPKEAQGEILEEVKGLNPLFGVVKSCTRSNTLKPSTAERQGKLEAVKWRRRHILTLSLPTQRRERGFQRLLSSNNQWGGKSLYPGLSIGGRAYVVSFNRPFPVYFTEDTTSIGAGTFIGLYEYNFLRWIEKQGYNLKYFTNVDVHANGAELLTAKVFLSVGHDEYWSWEMRENISKARDQGVSLAFLSSNSAYWQIRFEPDADGRPHRRLVCYKDHGLDPEPDPKLKTVKWRDNPVSRPEDTLLGVMYDRDYPPNAPWVVRDASHWLFRTTGMKNGDFIPGLLGFEADNMFFSAPRSLLRLATSPYIGAEGTQKFADTTLYQADSGALVFAAGSMQWIWGLDNFVFPGNPRHTVPFGDKRVEIITNNLLQEMIHPKFTGQSPPEIPLLLHLAFTTKEKDRFADSSIYNRSVLCPVNHCPETTGGAAVFKSGNKVDGGIEASLRGNEEFTISLWLKTTSSEGHAIIQQRDDHHSNSFMGWDGSFHLEMQPSGTLKFWTWDPPHQYSSNLKSQRRLNNGNWHFVVIRRQADGSTKLQVDGMIEATDAGPSAYLKPHILWIGHDPIGPYPAFEGAIDDVRIYKQALTDEQTHSLFRLGRT